MLAVHRWPNVGPTLFTQRQHYANGAIVGPTLGQRRLAIWGVGVIISRAERCLRKIVISHENGYIQAGNDPTAKKNPLQEPIDSSKKSARQIMRRVAAISRADRWLRKLVVSHENGYIQAGNDPTAKKILCKSP